MENQKAEKILHQPGLAKVTYPNDDLAYPVVTRELTVDRADKELPFLTADTEYPQCLLIAQPIVAQDHALVRVARVFERIPGPQILTSRIDPEDGAVINEIKQLILTSAAVVSASGPTSVRYEPRGDSDLVTWQFTTTTDLSNVVRSLPTTVNLRLPRVLAGVAVSYNVNKGTGNDTSRGLASGTGSRHDSASASASSSLGVIPEVFLPIRDNSDAGENFPAYVKQIYLAGSITPAAILARMTAVYEVTVATTAAAGTYLGNASNFNGVIWFSQGAYVLKWTAGAWALGTEAGILAGNYWKRTADATAWLGIYAPQGAASGTATVAVGRTVNAWPRWGTQEVNLITAGKQVSVKSNAAGSEELSATASSLTLTSGISVSVGGNQGRVRVEPTLHGAITIAKASYSDSVNATATATLSGLISSGINSGFPSGTNPYGNTQFVTSYVKFSAAPATSTPSAKVISSNTVASAVKTITAISAANPAVVTSTAHGFSTGDVLTISGTDSTPPIDGTRIITVLTVNTYSVAVDVSGAGTTGSAQRPTVVGTSTAHGLLTGDIVTIGGSNSTPTINGLRTVTVISTTTFSTPVVVTVAGTSGTVQGPSVAAGVTIPATNPPDVPSSGLYLMPGYQSSGKDSQYVQVNGTIVDMTLFPTAPGFIAYSDPAPTYFQGIAITANQPFYLGGAPTSYAISPSIPTGLSFSTTTGIITGTPSVGQVATPYTVTATNGQGSASTVITIAVSI